VTVTKHIVIISKHLKRNDRNSTSDRHLDDGIVMQHCTDGSTPADEICAVSCDDARFDDAGTTVIVLAGGAGTRFCDVGHKLLGSLPATETRPAETVARRSIAAAVDAGLGPVVVVTGRLSADDLHMSQSAPETDRRGVEPIHNADWASGQMSSLRVGLSSAERAGSAVAVIGLADQPGISPAAWRAVAAAADATTPIAVATYEGRRANPVALHRTVWGMLPDGGDEGARSLMRLRPELVREVPCTGSPNDIDTAEDLRRWQNS
jgi:CTP:molybdopterin cytidylyltransferase MocA